MTDKIFIVADGDDNYKDLFHNLNDYVVNSQYLNSDDEGFPRYKTNYRSFFNISMGCDHRGISNGMYLVDTRTHFCSNNVDSANPITPLSFKDEDYPYVDLAPNFLVQYLDKHASVYFMETTIHEFENGYDNVLKNFSMVYLRDGKFFNTRTEEQVHITNEVNCMLAAFKLGSLPVYIVILNNMYLHTMSAQEFEMPLIDAKGYTCQAACNDPFKEELFCLTFIEGVDNHTGDYMLHTNKDKIVFELFSKYTEFWGYNGRESINEGFLRNLPNLINIKDHITVDSNLPVTVTKAGKVTINTSKMIENEMGYISISVDFGDFFNNINSVSLRPNWEFAIVKTGPNEIEPDFNYAKFKTIE